MGLCRDVQGSLAWDSQPLIDISCSISLSIFCFSLSDTNVQVNVWTMIIFNIWGSNFDVIILNTYSLVIDSELSKFYPFLGMNHMQMVCEI